MKKTIDFVSKSSKWLLVFGIVFSQLAFPLGVLADEVIERNDEENTYADTTLDNENLIENDNVLETEEVVTDDALEDAMNDVPEEGNEIIEEPVDNPVVSENIVTINGEVTDNYVINPGDNTSVSIAVNGEERANFDFSNKLYGTYQYTIEGMDKIITIEYVGNNADILKKYEIGTDLSKKIRYDESNCVIAGFGRDIVTVQDIKAYYDLNAFMNDYNALVNVTRDGVALEDTVDVNANDKLEISTNDDLLVIVSENSSYVINRLGDIYVDNIIDRNDQELILNEIIRDNAVSNLNDINGDGILDILDATDSLFMSNDSAVENTTDSLKSVVELSSNEAVVGEEVKVSLKVSGFTNTSLYGIEGLVNYDDSILELVGANINGTNSLGSLNLENSKFAYTFDGFNSNGEALLVLTFKVIAVGNVDITISNLVASYGNRYNLENDTTTASLTVLDYGKGGDVDNNTTPATTATQEEVSATAVQVVNTVRANNETVDTYGEDNNAKEENKAVKKDKKKDSDDKEDEKNSTSKTIIIILIILVIIGLIYVIFKDDEEEDVKKTEDKIKPNTKTTKKSSKK